MNGKIITIVKISHKYFNYYSGSQFSDIPNFLFNGKWNILTNIDTRIFREIFGHYRQDFQFKKQEYPKFNSNSPTKSFFIDRHYTRLNEAIYIPLSNIIIQDSENGIRTRLHLITNINEHLLSHPFIQHLRNDDNNLYEQLQNLIPNIKQHNFMVKQMMYTIESIIKNKFIENGIFPVYDSNYHSIGYYHFQDVSHVLELIWIGFLISRNIETEVRRYDFHITQQLLRIGTFIIARRNDENELTEIQRIFEQVIRDRLILNSFNRLSENRQQLVDRINKIKNAMGNISQAIQENRYNTVCDCCRIQIPS